MTMPLSLSDIQDNNVNDLGTLNIIKSMSQLAGSAPAQAPAPTPAPVPAPAPSMPMSSAQPTNMDMIASMIANQKNLDTTPQTVNIGGHNLLLNQDQGARSQMMLNNLAQNYLMGRQMANQKAFMDNVHTIMGSPDDPAKKVQNLIQLKAMHNGNDYGLGVDDIAKQYETLSKSEAYANLSNAKADSALNVNDTKATTQQDKLEKIYADRLSASIKSRSGGVGVQDAKVNQAIHLRSMLDQYYDPKTDTYNVPQSQYEELAIGLANLISGSNSATNSMREGVMQRTAKGDIAGAIAYVTGTTPSASTKDVFNNLADSIDRQGLVSEKLRDKYMDGIRELAPTGLEDARRTALEKSTIGSRYSEYLQNSPAKKAQAVTSGVPSSGFVEGKIYKDAQGNRAMRQNGKWVSVE